MSTKATLELIEWAKAVADRAGDDGHWNLALEAKQEQHAIQKAAKALDAWVEAGMPSLDPEAAKKWNVIQSIAKEAP